MFVDSLLYDISNKILLIIILLCHCLMKMMICIIITYSSAKFENALLLISFLLVITFPASPPRPLLHAHAHTARLASETKNTHED